MDGFINFDKERISIQTTGGAIELYWNDVFSVSYYKINCIVNNISYLSFNTEYGETVEVPENIQGWKELINNLHFYLPISDTWFERLATITSEDEVIQIYKRLL